MIFFEHSKEPSIYKSWRNEAQRETKVAIKHYYHDNRVQVVKTNKKRDWPRPTTRENDVFNYLEGSRNTKSLANRIIDFFIILTDYFQCYSDNYPIMTAFKCKDIAHQSHLRQLVKVVRTRDSKVLDWFFTNMPKLSDPIC